MLENGTCYLCKESKTLVKSHIIPKFVYKRMFGEGGPLRRAVNPNLRVQDGVKKYLLCSHCECLFSKNEGIFCEGIFKEIQDNRVLSFEYSSDFHYFVVSLLWRTLIYYEEKLLGDGHIEKLLRKAEEVWRNYLLNREEGLNNFDEIHLLVSDVVNGNEKMEQFNRYLVHGSDATIALDDKECLVYVKFFRFLFFGWITPRDSSLWQNTKVEANGGKFCSNQGVEDAINSFLCTRVRAVEESFSNLSKRQEEKIAKFVEENADKIFGGDLGKAICADFLK